MRYALIWLFIGMAFSSSVFADDKLSRKDALTIAEKAAKANGIDLKHYKLGSFPRELSEDGKEWTFYFECAPGPVPPGCFFWVSVNRVTGAAEYSPGE